EVSMTRVNAHEIICIIYFTQEKELRIDILALLILGKSGLLTLLQIDHFVDLIVEDLSVEAHISESALKHWHDITLEDVVRFLKTDGPEPDQAKFVGIACFLACVDET